MNIPVESPRHDHVVLTLPADPRLARLARLVSSHFFLQNGLPAAAARRGAMTVEKRCLPLLRSAARGKGRPSSLVLILRNLGAILEVVSRTAGGSRTPIVRVPAPRSG